MRNSVAGFCMALGAAMTACNGGGTAAVGLSTVPVMWNPNMVAVGHVSTVIDDQGLQYVFSDTGLSVLATGTSVASDTSTTMWRRHAAVIPAADGTGTWVVAIDGMGRVIRVHAEMTLENISGRYGLATDSVLALAPVNATSVAFALQNEMAIQNASNITRYTYAAMGMPAPAGSPPDSFLASDGTRIAIAATDGVHAFDLAMQHPVVYRVPNASRVAFLTDGTTTPPTSRLVAATDHGIYVEDTSGTLQPVYSNAAATVHALVTAGSNVWFASGSELGMVNGSSVSLTSGLGIDPAATLDGSPSGDVWVIASTGTLLRFSLNPDQQRWLSTVYPIAQRVCAQCHSATNPTYGLDLTQYDVWVGHRALVDNAVFVTRDMPRAPGVLTDTERMTIHTWATMPAH